MNVKEEVSSVLGFVVNILSVLGRVIVAEALQQQ